MIIESPLGALLALCGSIAFFHFALIFVRPLGVRGWKKVDYWWLSFAAMGLVAAAGEVRRVRSPFGIEVAKAKADLALRFVKIFADPRMHCVVFLKTQFSPPDVDSLQAEQNRLCRWVQQIAGKLPDSVSTPRTIENIDHLPPRPPLTDPGFVRDAKSILDRVDDLQDAGRAWHAAERLSERNALETTMVVLSPWLLALAIGLRITKVTGELRLLPPPSSPR